MNKKIPVTIVTGFLGAGKTTLINKVLHEKHDEKIAVIINEFGSIGVDHQFVLDVEENIYQMDNGCLCCSLREDIAETLKAILLAKEDKSISVDRILFETTGLADPAPIAHTFINVPFLNDNFIVDAVLTVVDAKNFLHEIKIQDEPAKQVGFADKIFVSKHQLVSESEFNHVIREIKSINAFAPIQDLDAKPITLKDMFNLELFYASEEKILEMEERSAYNYCNVCEEHHHDSHHCEHCHHEHHHNEHCQHNEHCHHKGHSHHEHHEEHHHCTDTHCHHKHYNHNGISSFVIQTDKPLNLNKINRWLDELIFYYGENLYRYKGILYVENVDYQVIFQGVQMSFDINRGRDWGPTQKQTTFVFIGKDLPEEKLRAGFNLCLENHTDAK